MDAAVSFLISIADWLAAGGSLIGTWLYGNRKGLWAPIVSLVAQVPWMVLALNNSLYGLIVINVAFTVVHIRNLLKWYRERKLTCPT